MLAVAILAGVLGMILGIVAIGTGWIVGYATGIMQAQKGK
jgi:hypothetical protein